MPRLLFKKTGSAIWISHLDLMRLFQRAFKRAGLSLTHSGGFTPRPQVSIALPLSVGVASQCELLDFDLDGEMPAGDVIRNKLIEVLVSGVEVLDVYEQGRKIRDLALLECCVTLEYDKGVPCSARDEITALFTRDALFVEKRGKNGPVNQDIIPMIHRLDVIQKSEQELTITALICCQNPTLNPAQLCTAIENELPQYRPDFAKIERLEIFDANKTIFR